MPAKILGNCAAITSDIISGNSTASVRDWMNVFKQYRWSCFTSCWFNKWVGNVRKTINPHCSNMITYFFNTGKTCPVVCSCKYSNNSLCSLGKYEKCFILMTEHAGNMIFHEFISVFCV